MTPEGSHDRWRRLGRLALLVLLPLLLYGAALESGFHLDDFPRLVQNPEVRRVAPWWRHFLDPGTSSARPWLVCYRPMMPLSFSLEVWLAGGVSSPVHHAGNLGLHLVAVLLVLALARELLRQGGGRVGPEAAWAVASLYAVHPVAGVAVHYVCARDLLLMQVFTLGSLLVYVRSRVRGEGPLGWALALGLYALGLLSKQNPLLLPAGILVYEWLLVGGADSPRGRSRPWLRAGAFALVLAGYLGVQLATGRRALGLHIFLGDRPLLSLANLGDQLEALVTRYLPFLVWPPSIRMEPSFAPDGWTGTPALLGAALVLATGALVWRLRGREPVVGFGLVMAALMVAPTSSVFPLMTPVVPYRPLPGLPYLFLALISLAAPRLGARTGRALLGGALLGLGLCALWLNPIWRDHTSLWSHSVAVGGNSRAFSLLAAGTTDPARRAALLEQALALEPLDWMALSESGLFLVLDGHERQGLERLRTACRIYPSHSTVWVVLSRALAHLGRLEEAASAALLACQRAPRHAPTVLVAAERLRLAGRAPEAALLLEALAEQQPDLPLVFHRLGYALEVGGRTEAAMAAYRAHLARHPEHAESHRNLGLLLASRGELAAAAAHLGRALEVRPDWRPLRLQLWGLRRQLGDGAGAARELAAYRATEGQVPAPDAAEGEATQLSGRDSLLENAR